MAESHGQEHDGECAHATGKLCICSCRGALHGVSIHGGNHRIARMREVHVKGRDGDGAGDTPAERKKHPAVVTVAHVERDDPGAGGGDKPTPPAVPNPPAPAAGKIHAVSPDGETVEYSGGRDVKYATFGRGRKTSDGSAVRSSDDQWVHLGWSNADDPKKAASAGRSTNKYFAEYHAAPVVHPAPAPAVEHPTPPVDVPDVEHVAGRDSITLPHDLTPLSDDELAQHFADLSEQGRDADVMRVWDEMGRREEAAAHAAARDAVKMPAELRGIADERLADLFAHFSQYGGDHELQRLYDEMGRRDEVREAEAARQLELARPPAGPLYVDNPTKAWMRLAGSPITGLDGGWSNEITRARAQHAIRLTYGLGPDATEHDIAAAMKTDDRPNEVRLGMQLAWYRKLAEHDGVPNYSAEYGPEESATAKAAAEARAAERAAAEQARVAELAQRDAALARLEQGPAGPVRVDNPVHAWGDIALTLGAYRNTRHGQDARDRYFEAQRRSLGLPEGTDPRKLKAAALKDPRSLPEQSADMLAWYRLLGEAHGVTPESDYSRGWELGPPDTRAEPMRAPALPADVPKAWDAWQEIRTQAYADKDAGDPATLDRYTRAIGRSYGLPDDVHAYEIKQANMYDPRKPDAQAAAFIAEYRRLGAEHNVDPADRLRYGPADRAVKARPSSGAHWGQSTPEQEAKIDGLLARGWTFLDAYADVHGIDPEKLRGDEGKASVGRVKGQTTAAALRRSYDEHVHAQYLAAEQATNGYMLSKDGERAGITDPVVLFSGNTATAHKYASEELRRYWTEHPRMTFAEFKAQVVGSREDKAAAKKTRLQGNGKDFG